MKDSVAINRPIETINKVGTVKAVLSGHSKRTPKLGFQYRLLLNADQKYYRMLLCSDTCETYHVDKTNLRSKKRYLINLMSNLFRKNHR